MIPQSVRKGVLPAVDRAISPLGLYAMYRLTYDELIAEKIERSVKRIEGELETCGFEYHGISAAKIHPAANIIDSGSYRYIPEEHPNIDARITREWEPEQCQYHIHIFRLNGFSQLYSHYELRHDFFSPSINLERTRTHYRPEYGEDYIKGEYPGVISNFLF